MRKHNLIPVYMMVIFILLSGCTSSTSTEQIETSSTLHNYDIEMISKALEKHSDFPILNPDETLKEEIESGENNITITYSSNIEVIPHSTITKHNENLDVWVEDSNADYFITLVKVREHNQVQVKSYWKYRYLPTTNEVELCESEDNEL